MIEINDPQAIEARSMEIIGQEIGELNCSPAEEKIIKRIIHATAEPELVESIVIAPTAVEAGLKALESGVNIVTDVNMLKAGINKRKVAANGGEVKCFISDEEVAHQARKQGITRSMMAMRRAVRDESNRIFAIGNAPTALFELIRLVREDRAEVDLIVGTPVGFVGARESKEELEKLDVPFITLRGRKGGSPVAASIMNALLYMIA